MKYLSPFVCNDFCSHVQVTFLKDFFSIVHIAYLMNYRYTGKKSDSKASVFTLLIEENSKKSSELADRKEN
jgi:hypothetical protein